MSVAVRGKQEINQQRPKGGLEESIVYADTPSFTRNSFTGVNVIPSGDCGQKAVRNGSQDRGGRTDVSQGDWS